MALVALGLAVLALAAAIAANLPAPRPRAGLILLVTTGLAILVGGAFPTDPVDPTNPVFLSTAGVVHTIAAMVAAVSVAVAAPLLTRRLATPARSLTRVLRGLGAAPPLGVAIFATVSIFDRPLGTLFHRPSATGLGERVMIAALVAWVAVVALSLLRTGHDHDAHP